MESKGFVLVGFFAFWLGACLAFIVNIDAENITILTAATVAGLLSYMTIIVSEENEKNKKERDSLDYIRMVCQSYQEDLIKLVMVMAYRTIDFKMLKEERKKTFRSSKEKA